MCAYIWMLICAIHVAMFCGNYDFIILDQVSFPIPILWIMNSNIIFYCHYPDKLLCVERASFFKRAYRFILDLVEELTTGMAKVILVNSKFTAGVFGRSFKLLNKFRSPPLVVYPAIQEEIFKVNSGLKVEDIIGVKPGHLLMSLNRYEWKKNIPLALQAFSEFLKMFSTSKEADAYHLVIAGGYDDAVAENKEVYD